ncbi:hypothetical protein POKO110462_03155 [Pontibacter korlensis]|uniref:STAS/SEC14 domain-containing protein n=1 Tax=Pontibacter korlensis TaxID=400092 RepID=A0A0E3ZEP5_9BACT|nr:hypothetical protein [Pontibacter korlensis]AKD03884.1 hypothetical protein PKOR_13140 [Pontibacter korlensis]
MSEKEITIIDEPEFLIFVRPTEQLMVVQAKGVVPSRIYRKGLSAAIETAIEMQLKFWLVNNKAGGIISTEDQIWATEITVPRLASASRLKKMAFIVPDDVLSKLILENLMDLSRPIYPFEMQFFDRLEDAYRWFRDTEKTL